jgi:phage/plasmid-like protein (TIGR03299 family)
VLYAIRKGTFMPHEIDINQGVASFASRTDAWHQLGQVVGHAMTAEEALSKAHLAGWNVHKLPLRAHREPEITADGVTALPPLEVPSMFATVRTNPITKELDVLGVVGSKYECVQNEASCAALNALTGESGAVFETAGALRGGREAFVTMKLPESMTFDGKDGSSDRTEWFLASLSDHTGAHRNRLLLTPVRIVCANTQSAAIARARAEYAITHTRGAKLAIQEAREALKLSWRYIEAFEAEAAELYATAMDVEQASRFARKLFKVEQADTVVAERKRTEQANAIVKLFVSSPTVAPILGETKWAAYNAVSEYADHFAAVRGAQGADESAAARALRTVTAGSSTHALKVEAFKMLQAA